MRYLFIAPIHRAVNRDKTRHGGGGGSRLALLEYGHEGRILRRPPPKSYGASIAPAPLRNMHPASPGSAKRAHQGAGCAHMSVGEETLSSFSIHRMMVLNLGCFFNKKNNKEFH